MSLLRISPWLIAAFAAAFIVLLLPAQQANAVSYTLNVSSTFGNSFPERGVHVRESGVTVFCSVDEYLQLDDGERVYCSGWVGTGSVPPTGNANSMHFVIGENSSIEWQWETYYELKVRCDYDVDCVPPIGAAYYKEGTVIDLGAPLFSSDILFDGYSGTGEIANGAEHYLTITLNSASTITWFYRNANLIRSRTFGASPTVVDDSERVGKYSSIAIDPQTGYPAISYLDEANGNLNYAVFDGTEWNIEVVDDSLLVGQHTQLVFDGSGSPVIVYYGYGYRNVHIAQKDIEGNWFTDLLGEAGYVGRFSGVTVLPGARLGVVFYDESNGNLAYREYQDGFWSPDPHLILDGAQSDTGQYALESKTNAVTGRPAE
ncbi:MAG: hypothetical protein U5N86_02520 [Planctomycetota bacterium]|nr:hypothetical protein [Planctomycetota bacterium]